MEAQCGPEGAGWQVDGMMKKDVRGTWSEIEVWGQIIENLKYQLT